VLYGYTESDEISLLFAPDEQAFGRKLRKYNSTLAGEVSAQFSVRLGQVASFDCRISQLPTVELVIDYFRVTGGGKVWRLAGEKCSARVVEGPRGSVVGGSRRGVSEAFRAL